MYFVALPLKSTACGVYVVGQKQNILAAVHRCGLNHVVVVTDYVFFAVANVDGRFENFYAQLGKGSAFHSTDEFFGFATEHRSANYFNRALSMDGPLGVSFGKHISIYDLIVNCLRFAAAKVQKKIDIRKPYIDFS